MITEEQKEKRKGKIGSSDVAAALGISPWKTQARLASEMLGLIEPEPMDININLGNLFEPALAKMFEQRMECELEPFNHTLEPERFPFLIAHPDYRMKKSRRKVEFKVVGFNSWDKWGEDGDPGGVPVYVVAQCIAQSLLEIGFAPDVMYVGAYFSGIDFRIYELEIDEESKRKLWGGLKSFWSYIQSGDIPMATDKDISLFQELYPEGKEDEYSQVIDDPFELIGGNRKYNANNKKMTALKKENDEIKAKFQQQIGENEGLKIGDDVIATWKNDKEKEVTLWEGMAREFVDEKHFGKYTETIPGARRFNMKKLNQIEAT